MENEILKFLACLKYRKSLERAILSIKKAKDDLKHGSWQWVDTGYFRHRYTDLGHTNLGVPKFNPY